jgi:hypothetical protein
VGWRGVLLRDESGRARGGKRLLVARSGSRAVVRVVLTSLRNSVQTAWAGVLAGPATKRVLTPGLVSVAPELVPCDQGRADGSSRD